MAKVVLRPYRANDHRPERPPCDAHGQFDRAQGKANAEDALSRHPDLAGMVGLAPSVGAFAAGLILDQVQYRDFNGIFDIGADSARIVRPYWKVKFNELTREGHAMIGELLPLVVDEMNTLLEPLDRSEFELFRGMLRRVLEHLQQAPAAPPPAPPPQVPRSRPARRAAPRRR